ncbi:response regulator [Rubrivirga sp. IMCC45206]|uniref:hybrid sensor histidine kinase/response regulator n=1 Tax=Rubrivirga sp. IMCC45206 TaxID=3391614 RepID=UPI00398F93E2
MPSSPALRVLLVDDDSVDRARVRRALRPDHVVREAATAREGRSLAEAPAGSAFDVVLLDLRLPDAEGVDLLPWFGERGLPVVMLTGVEDTPVVVDAMQRGALDYLSKARLDGPSLERALQRAVETAALRRSLAEQRAEIVAQRDRLATQAATLAQLNADASDLARALTLAEQSERHRVSLLLHDQVQQILFGARLMLTSALRVEDTAEALVLVRDASAALGVGIEATRQLALDLTPPVLDSDDYAVALRWLGDHVGATYGLKVDVRTDAPVVIADREVRVLITEVVRELLFNVVKHAGTDRATVHLRCDDGRVEVEVSDRGRGFDTEAPSSSNGFGLYSVRRRLELLGGHLDVDARVGGGARFTLHAPVHADR